MTDVYVVIQQSVYRHDIIGAYSTLEAAKLAGRQAIEDEEDHFHAVVVVACELDGRGEREVGRWRWRRTERPTVDQRSLTYEQRREWNNSVYLPWRASGWPIWVDPTEPGT